MSHHGGLPRLATSPFVESYVRGLFLSGLQPARSRLGTRVGSTRRWLVPADATTVAPAEASFFEGTGDLEWLRLSP